MALEAIEKAPFPANFQSFSQGFIRVFRHLFSEPRKPARIECQKRWLSPAFRREGVPRVFPSFTVPCPSRATPSPADFRGHYANFIVADVAESRISAKRSRR
jgi:hypothetical protein